MTGNPELRYRQIVEVKLSSTSTLSVGFQATFSPTSNCLDASNAFLRGGGSLHRLSRLDILAQTIESGGMSSSESTPANCWLYTPADGKGRPRCTKCLSAT